MGVDYTQHCIYGLSISSDEVRTVVGPAVYEEQNRYDTKTGKISHTEKVLVKAEDEKYSFLGIEAESSYELYEALTEQFPDLDISMDCDAERIYMGFNVADGDNYGHVSLLTDEVSIEYLQNLHKNLVKALRGHEEEYSQDNFSLHFFTNIG